MKQLIVLALMLSLGLSPVAFAHDGEDKDGRGKDKDHREDKIEQLAEVDLACMKTAVSVREAAVAKVFSDFSVSMSTALSARASALNTAWSLTDREELWDAVSDAWKVFKRSKREAKQTYHKAAREAWRTFRDDRIDCGLEFELEARGVDNSL